MPGRDLCLLSLDGGGVRGLSTLAILKQVMETISFEANLDEVPKPCEYFDMIGGTSTGGLLAIMLGRLRMSVDDCIDAYMEMSDKIFQKKHWLVNVRKGEVQARFDTAALERSIKKIIREQNMDEDNLLKDTADSPCKVFVCCTNTRSAEVVHLSSYRRARGGGDRLKSVKIWEAARATSAASSFFEPTQIQMGTYTESFVDGATGANNPVQEVWNEAKDSWSCTRLEDDLKCLISIGTGVQSVEAFEVGLMDIVGTLTRLSTDTSQRAESFARAHSDLTEAGRYFRFDVQNGLQGIGLEKADQKHAIMTLTDRYIQSEPVFNMMRKCGKTLAEREIPNSRKREVDATARRLMDGQQLELSGPSIVPNELVDKISTYRAGAVQRRIAELRCVETAKWLLQRSEFQSWSDGTGSPCFWLLGPLGCGKTVITSAVVEFEKANMRHPGSPVIHFYCQPEEHTLLSATHLYSREIHFRLREFYATNAILPDNEDAADLLLLILEHIPHGTVVIDGIEALELADIKQLLKLLRRISWSQQTHRIFLSSRDPIHTDLKLINWLPSLSMVSIEEEDTENDIKSYIDNEIADKMALTRELTEDQTLIGDIKHRLRDEAHGMFLWVFLQIDALWSIRTNDNDIRAALGQLPRTLNETYRKCLERLSNSPGHVRAVATLENALKWIISASRPLTLDELREAVAFGLDDTSWDAGKIPNATILVGCFGSLVLVNARDGRVRLVHPSLASFLSAFPPNATVSSLNLPIEADKTFCGELCVSYLNFTDFNLQIERKPLGKRVKLPAPASIVQSPVMGKALGSLITKTWFSGRPDQSAGVSGHSVALKQRVTQDHLPHKSKYHLLLYAREFWTIDTREMDKDRSPVLWAKFQKLALSLNNTWKLHPWTTSVELSYRSHLHGLLYWAARIEHLPLLNLLLTMPRSETYIDQYIDIPFAGDGLSAFHAAARSGSVTVLRILLRVPCAINTKDQNGATALHHAAERGHKAAVEWLLDQFGIMTEQKSSSGETPFQVAVRNGRVGVAYLLWTRGKSPGGKDEKWFAKIIGKNSKINRHYGRPSVEAEVYFYEQLAVHLAKTRNPVALNIAWDSIRDSFRGEHPPAYVQYSLWPNLFIRSLPPAYERYFHLPPNLFIRSLEENLPLLLDKLLSDVNIWFEIKNFPFHWMSHGRYTREFERVRDGMTPSARADVPLKTWAFAIALENCLYWRSIEILDLVSDNPDCPNWVADSDHGGAREFLQRLLEHCMKPENPWWYFVVRLVSYAGMTADLKEHLLHTTRSGKHRENFESYLTKVDIQRPVLE